MRKFLVITTPIVTLILFILIMLSCSFLKKPLGKNDNIPESIQMIHKNVDSDNWNSAIDETENLSNAWNKVVKRIQFSCERDEINAFDANLARLRGAIIAEDKSASYIELSEAYEHWNGFGK